LRSELHGQGVEIITVGLEMGGAEVLRPIVEAARPEHPSLLDATHQMDALFGVTNIPQVLWIDEEGVIVRPPERGSPAPQPTEDPFALYVFQLMARGTTHPEWYGDRIRDWAAKGSASEWVMSPDAVIAASHPRTLAVSEAAAHFALAQHLWRTQGFSAQVLGHFERAHTLQPENITYKRQAYSAWSFAKSPQDLARFSQSPNPGEEEQWPFVSEFYADAKEYLGLDLRAS
jgi:hypothetical protein